MANPFSNTVQSRLNEKVKHRENFRPFAPIIMEEEEENIFEFINSDEFMLTTTFLKEDFILKKDELLSKETLKDKLEFKKSKFPGITHVDYSARVQIVKEQRNKNLYKILSNIKNKTGHGILVNTSFNDNNEPIILTPDDALKCFEKTKLDYLVIGNYVIENE